jgi:hypothetical protein
MSPAEMREARMEDHFVASEVQEAGQSEGQSEVQRPLGPQGAVVVVGASVVCAREVANVARPRMVYFMVMVEGGLWQCPWT